MANLEIFKSTCPIKAVPKIDQILETQFVYFIAKLLSIKAENEENVINSLPAVKEHFWSMGLHEIKKAFEMYADGKLDLKPKSNYFDRVLVGQIFAEYKKQQKRPKPKAPTKDEIDTINCISIFDNYLQTKELDENLVWIYTYLTEFKKVVQFSKDEKLRFYNDALEKYKNKETAITQSKLNLLKAYFDKLNSKGLHINNII